MRQMKYCLVIALFAVCYTVSASAQTTAPVRIVLDGAATGRVFDGLGAASAGASSRLLIDYPEPQRSQILDYLFKPNYGAALQHLKVEVGADVNSTDGSEPSPMRSPSDHSSTRGYEGWLMTEAHKRNPNIVLEILPWGAPGWVDQTLPDTNSPAPDRNSPTHKPTLYTRQMAGYLVDFIRAAKRDYGLDIAYVGSWNEKPYNLDFIHALARELHSAHLDTKIVCCDQYPEQHQWAIADEMLKDPQLAREIAVIGVHYPLVQGHISTPDAARRTGKPLWSSEDQPNPGSGPFLSRDWPVGGRILAHLYNQNYIEGSLTSTEIWSPITSYYDNLAAPNSGLMYANTPWSGHYDVQGAIWATAHTTQFAQPGWQYLDSACGNLPSKGSYVSLRSPNRRDWSIVLETIGALAPQTVAFSLKSGLSASTVHIWETNSARTFAHVANITPVNGSFTYTFDPDSLYSLTTTTGQTKGSAMPPPPAPFPFPYTDNFDSTALNHTPKYLSDQDGAFEVRNCAGRAGRCLEQVITALPIPWNPLPDPFTLAGDDRWTDYTLSADVRFLSASAATLIGRIDSADVFQDEKALYPTGYVLLLEPTGAWSLLSTEFKKPAKTLASGNVPLDRAAWHALALSFHGSSIEALLDGKSLATAQDSTHTHGMIALGSQWNRIQFDSLAVRPN
jgi:O-glycosyl hydrolase